MASLVGQQLKDTYDSLLKTSDNDALGVTYKEITDGAGNGSNLYLGTGGNVGIGTTSPSAKLSIVDSPAVSENVVLTSNSRNTGANSGFGDYTLFGSSTSTSFALYGRKFISGPGWLSSQISSGGFLFSTGALGSETERMRINSGGDISFRDGSANEAFYWDASAGSLGIGTTSPGTVLDIHGTGNVLHVGTGTNVAQYMSFRGSGGSGAYIGYDGAGMLLQAGDGKNFRIKGGNATFNSGATGLEIDTSGNVGIGTTNIYADGLSVGNTDNNSFISSGGENHHLTLASTGAGGALRFFTQGGTNGNRATTESMRIDTSGNLLVGTTATPTSSAGNIVLGNGTAPTGNATDGVILYAEDFLTSSELKVRDEAGNVTTLSPHNFSLIPNGASEPMAWAYYSERDGKKINVDMLKLARMVESLTGEKLVYEQ